MLQKFLNLLAQLFGHIQWSKPAWINRLFERAKPGLQQSSTRLSTHLSAHKKLYKRGLTVALVATSGALIGYRIIQSLPKPNQVTFEVQAPSPMSVLPNSVPNPLVIRFSASAARLDLIQKPIPADALCCPSLH